MELIFVFGGVGLIAGLILFFMGELNRKQSAWLGILLTIYIIIFTAWFNSEQEIKYIEVKVATTDNIEWKYYVTLSGQIRPIANNVKKVRAVHPRPFALDGVQYELIYN